jgi:ABC-type protease/lipase transport system fused ATPase/permease subunit
MPVSQSIFASRIFPVYVPLAVICAPLWATSALMCAIRLFITVAVAAELMGGVTAPEASRQISGFFHDFS